MKIALLHRLGRNNNAINKIKSATNNINVYNNSSNGVSGGITTSTRYRIVVQEKQPLGCNYHSTSTHRTKYRSNTMILNDKYNHGSTARYNIESNRNSISRMIIPSSTMILQHGHTNRLLQTSSTASATTSAPSERISSENNDIVISESNKLKKAFDATTTPNKPSIQNRAQIKKQILQKALMEANQAKINYHESNTATATTTIERKHELYKNWKEKEEELSKSYHQAIQYICRDDTNKGSIVEIESLLTDMMKRCGIQVDEDTTTATDRHVQKENKKSPTLQKISLLLDDILTSHNSKGQTASTSTTKLQAEEVMFPPPTKRIFVQILQTISKSKIYKKGLYADTLLLHLFELQRYQLQLLEKESSEMDVEKDDVCSLLLLDSNIFSLVIRCHANSSYGDSLQHIIELHKIHDTLATSSSNNISCPKINPHNPFLYLNSLKALKEYRTPKQRACSKLWFDQLYTYAITNTAALEEEGQKVIPLDLTPITTAIIREYIKAKLPQSPDRAFTILQKALLIKKHLIENETNHVSIRIDSNLYDLVFKAILAKDDVIFVKKYASRLMDDLLSSWVHWKKVHNDVDDNVNDDTSTPVIQDDNDNTTEITTTTPNKTTIIPIPSDKSLNLYLQVLSITQTNTKSHIKSTSQDFKTLEHRAKQILQIYQEMYASPHLQIKPSIDVYASFLDFYIKCYPHYNKDSVHLLSIIKDIVTQMEKEAELYPDLKPNGDIYALVLKACSIIAKHCITKKNKYPPEMLLETQEYSNEVYDTLLQMEKRNKDKTKSILTEECYAFKMKCVHLLEENDDLEKKEEKIVLLFKDACAKGLVNVNVVFALKNTLHEEEYNTMVGDGRLPTSWVRNVTSGKAFYTDGSRGGAGKYVNRKKKKGKSNR